MSTKEQNNTLGWLLLVGVAWLLLKSPPTSPGHERLTRVRLVVEEKAGVPPEIRNAMRQHPEGLDVDVIDQHVKDGNGMVPERHRVALEAATQHGVPVLVLEFGSTVQVRVRPTEEDILELWR